jgi:hypothetical protein
LTLNLYQGGKKLFKIAEYQAASKLIRFNTLPIYLNKSAITLQENQKITFTIKVMGNIQPCSKRFAFYINERGLKVEEI